MMFHQQDYPCTACKANNAKFILRKQELNIVKCRQCEFVYVNPRVSTNDLLSIYQHNYFNNKKLGYVNYEQEKRLRIKNFERWLTDIKPFLPPTLNIRALDVGCAAGYCLDVMKTKGYNAEGLELDEEMNEELAASGHKVFKKTLSDFYSKEKYSLITMFDVIEHIPDVDDSFDRLNNLLEKDGILVIITPDFNSLQRMIFGKRWFQFKPIEHIQYFTKKSLLKIAKRNNFEIVYHSSCGQYADAEFAINRLNYYGFSFLSKIFKKIFSIFNLKNNFFYTDTGSLLAVFKKVKK